jgi:hypothetical protein
MHFLNHFLTVAGVVAVALLLGAGVLHLLARLRGRAAFVSAALCRAPALDWVITYFTVLPLIVGPAVFGWAGFVGALAGQVLSVHVWIMIQEWIYRDAVRGPRIVKVVNRINGTARNHAALWLTATVTPALWLVRLIEIVVYPPLRLLVRFPKYNQGDWVNVSRHKFSGLVGHDLIWCLYCDWMTGVWSLGTEMLRNVESFWCPIRFDNEKKCANCAVDFPDVQLGWVHAGGNMREVTETLEKMHSNGFHGWFGHPARLTVKGAPHLLETARETGVPRG